MTFRPYLVGLWFLAVAPVGFAMGQGFSPGEAAGRMTCPDDVAVELVASEPLVRQPVAIDFDDRGRLWVMEYLQYPNPEGLQRASVDRYSRTTYDRVPEPPPRGPRGGDRLSILLDDDGDGRADRAQAFVEGLNLASGFVHGREGVFVLQVPYLLFYPDRDGNDVPDGDPKVLLTGFGMEDAHSVANSLTWGPDGWLYGLQGSTCTARIRGIEFQQGVWRYHVEQDRFELFAEGGGNMWGLDFDSAGQLITSTNLGGYTSMHAVQGGYYWKSFGKHGPLHHPYAFGYFDHIPCERFEGGHVSVGGLFYASDGLPERYRGQYLYANLLSHSLAQQRLEPLGSTFRGGPTQEWIRSNDSWFAPTDLCVGPDGGVYVSDWHDRRTAHPDPDADWDRTNGRIYRLRGRSETARRWTEIKDPIAALMDADGWRYRRALRQISDGPDRYRPDPLLEELKSRNSVAVLRGIWGLHALGSWNDELACGMLDHESPDVRAWTIRLAGDWPDRFPALIHRLPAVAREDSSPRVWSQLASTARRLPADEGMSILLELVHRGELAADPLVPLLVWWGIEEHASQDLARWVPKIQRQRGVESALYRDVVLPRLMKRCVAEGSPTGWQAFRLLLDEADEATARTGMLSFAEGMDLTPSSARPGSDQTLSRFAQGKDAKGAPPAEQRTVPAEIRELVGLHWQRHREDPIFQRAAIDAGLIEARTTLTQWAGDPTQPLDRRRQSVQLLARWGGKDLLDLADLLLRPNSPPELQKEALLLLGRIDDDSVADRLLGAYATSSDSLRSDIRAVMTTRAGWTRRLLVEVEAGRISLASIPLDEVRRMVGTEDEQVLAAVGRLWGAVRSGTPEEKLAEVRRLNNDLNAAQGSLAAGRQLYLTHCSQCHQLFGEGSAVGPELTHANRQDREFLLVSLVDPSLTIRKEYVSLTCELRDGRVLQGVVTQQQGETITLVDSHARPTTLARGDIVEIKESLVSLMPEDLYRKLSPQELRDLFAYVQSDGLARTDAEKESGH